MTHNQVICHKKSWYVKPNDAHRIVYDMSTIRTYMWNPQWHTYVICLAQRADMWNPQWHTYVICHRKSWYVEPTMTHICDKPHKQLICVTHNDTHMWYATQTADMCIPQWHTYVICHTKSWYVEPTANDTRWHTLHTQEDVTWKMQYHTIYHTNCWYVELNILYVATCKSIAHMWNPQENDTHLTFIIIQIPGMWNHNYTCMCTIGLV